jgi:hypothetical protein
MNRLRCRRADRCTFPMEWGSTEKRGGTKYLCRMLQLEHLYRQKCKYRVVCIMLVHETRQGGSQGREGKTSKDDQPEGSGQAAAAPYFDSGIDGVVQADQETGYAAPGHRRACLVQEIGARLPDADQPGAAGLDKRSRKKNTRPVREAGFRRRQGARRERAPAPPRASVTSSRSLRVGTAVWSWGRPRCRPPSVFPVAPRCWL